MSLGKWDVRRMFLLGYGDKYERFMYHVVEKGTNLVETVRKTHKNVQRGSVIADLSGFNLRQHGCLRC